MTAAEQAAKLVDQHGDQAYHQALELALIACMMGNMEATARFAAAADLLIDAGYHTHLKRKEIGFASCEVEVDPERDGGYEGSNGDR